MKLLFFVLLALLSLNSCDLFHLMLVKERNNEGIEEVNRFLNRHSYRYDKSVLFNDSLQWLRKSDEYIFSKNSGLASAIELRVFDSIGGYYTSFSTCHGDFNKRGFLSEIPIKKNNHQEYINQTLSLKKELVLFDINSEEKAVIEANSTRYKYTFVVYYTIWTNYFSKRVLREVSRFKKHYPKQVYVVLCNVAID